MNNIVREDINTLLSTSSIISQNIKNSSFLITGATGMIGRYMVFYILESIRKYRGSGKVIVHTRDQAKAESVFSEYLHHDNLSFLVGDINRADETIDSIDYIIHAASPTRAEDFLDRPVDIIRVNALLTDELLTMANKHSAKLCLLSTLEIYGEVWSESYPAYVTEDQYGALDSIDLRSAYPESKRLAENLCVAHKQQFDTDSTVVRLAPTISPLIDPDDTRVYAQFINFVTNNQDITMFSDAYDKKRTYTYVADVITGVLVALLTPSRSKKISTYNLSNTENTTSIGELARTIIRLDGDNVKLQIKRREDTSNTSTSTGLILLDSTKLINAGWSPLYNLERCISQTLKCAYDNPASNTRNA